MDFKDRQKEKAEINELLDSNRFEFLIIYGRRRIGKTELILHCAKKRRYFYYLATTENNLERFYNSCIAFSADAGKLKKDFEVLFDFLKDRAEAIIIDEFQNLIKEDRNILSLFQAIIDTKLKGSGSKLVLLGSSVSIMVSKTLSYQSPLYGRKTASMKLRPMSFFDLREFYPEATGEELVEIFGFADGVPHYLAKIKTPFWKWLDRELKQEKGFIKDEADFLMRYEFDNPGTYKLIIEAIANGKTRINEIKDFMKVKRTDISPYIKNLQEIEIIKREIPINENQKSRNGKYHLNDNFLKFWFRFIYPNLSGVEQGIFGAEAIKNHYPEFLGRVFEDICRQFLARKNGFTKIGKWWLKDREIDIICLNEEKNESLFAECKWKEKINAMEVAKRLDEKTRHFQWKSETRKESLAVFAKSFSRKITEFNGKKVRCFDLKDMMTSSHGYAPESSIPGTQQTARLLRSRGFPNGRQFTVNGKGNRRPPPKGGGFLLG